jgi:hypothetical protein
MSKFIFAGIIFSAIGGVASSMAETNVYSENVVGYYNVDAPALQKILVSNQLRTTNDYLSSLFPGPWADGTIFFPYFGGYTASPWDTDANAWSFDFRLPIGQGAFLFSPVHQTFTFIGEVPQGILSNNFPRNLKSIRGPMAPLALTLSQMNLPAEAGDIAFQYRNGFQASPYDTDAVAWSYDFTNQVGEAFFYQKGSGLQTNWAINFTVQ